MNEEEVGEESITIKPSIKKNYFYNLLYQFLTLFVPLITTPYLSRVLGADGVGIQSFTLSIVTYFIIFAAFGFNIYGQREIARHRNDGYKVKKFFYEIFFCRLLLSFFSLVIYFSFVILGIFGENHTAIYFILGLNIIAQMLDIIWLFQGFESFKSISIRNIIIKLLGTIAIFIFVKTSNDLWIAVLINSLMLLFSSISLWIMVPKLLTSKEKIKDISITKHLRGSFVYFVPTLAVQVYTILDKTMIGLILKSNEENGFYEQAEKLVKLCVTVVTSINIIMRSRISYLYEHQQIDEINVLTRKSVNLFSHISFPIMFGISAVAGVFVPLFLGEGYDKCIYLIYVLSPLILSMGLSNLLSSHYLTPVGLQKKNNQALIIGAIINFLMNLILIKLLNTFGAAISTVVAETVIMILFFIYSKEGIKIKEVIRSFVKPLISSIIMFLVVFFMSTYLTTFNDFFVISIGNVQTNICSVFYIALGVLIYVVCMILLRDEWIINILNYIFKRKKNAK